jgi:hypothetical protein
MAAAAHNPAFAKKAGIPVSVAKEFNQADKGRKFREGGAMVKRLFKGKETSAEELKEAKALKSGKISPKQFVRGEKSEGHKEENSASIASKIKSGKMSPAAYAKMESKEPKGMRKGGSCKGYKAGGKVRYNDGGMPDYEREPSAEDRKQQEGAMAEYTARKEREDILSRPLAKASFKEAFAEARANGDKTFEYMGKKYSTDVAKPEKSFAEKAKKAGFASAETKGGAALMTRKDRSTGMKSGGKVRGCGCAVKGKTKGRMV